MIQSKLFKSSTIVVIVLQSLGNASFLCIIGSRLIFNLREAGELGVNEGTNYRVSSQSASEIEFAEGDVLGQDSSFRV